MRFERLIMNILIDDGMQIQIGTGIGKYSQYLYDTLKKRLDKQGNVSLATFERDARGKKLGRLRYLAYINSPSYRRICRQYDVVHYTNFAIPFIRSRGTKYVVTIHDLASVLHPETLSKAYVLYSQFVIKHSMKCADVVLTDSYAMDKEIGQHFPKYKNKVRVARPGLYTEYGEVGETACKAWESERLSKIADCLHRKQFFLAVGTVEKRKNLGIIVDAFIKLKKEYPSDYKLILAGRPGIGYEELREKIDGSGIAEDIVTTGYISSKDCRQLYRCASAYIFPTVYEGFGSPQLECMANHLPLILSDIPTNREVSEEYGLFFQLGDVDGLARQMLKIIDGDYPREEKNGLADEILEKYKWGTLIDDYLKAYMN